MNRNVLSAIFCAAAALCAVAGRGEMTRAEKIRAKLESSDRNYVFVVMHRGDWRHAPENSVGSIKGSIEHGADIPTSAVSAATQTEAGAGALDGRPR